MGRGIVPVASPELEELRRRFKVWRGGRRKGRRIPEELWEAAAGLAQELGVARVAQSLSLSHSGLKRRVAGPVATAGPSAPAFVEFPVQAVAPECVLELQGPQQKLTLHLRSHPVREIAALAEALWRV
jgi:hypothetical protein